MIRKKPAPHLMRGGNRFSLKAWRAPAQNCGTMEARADEGTSVGIIKRSPRRSNNIRRSNAVDRMRGKRWTPVPGSPDS